MMRGIFGNVRIRNLLVSPKEGSYTLSFSEKKEVFVYDAAMKAINAGKPLPSIPDPKDPFSQFFGRRIRFTDVLGVDAVS